MERLLRDFGDAPTLVNDAYAALGYSPSAARDERFQAWLQQLRTLPSAPALVRQAAPTPEDGRRMMDLQVVSEPITVRGVRDNVATIVHRRVLLAEIDGVHLGFCVSHASSSDAGPLFMQVVGVAADARRRGIGLTLLTAAAAREPHRDIALATQNSNTAARALNEQVATSIGARLARVPLNTYRDRDRGIRRGDGYRAWLIRRPSTQQPDKSSLPEGAPPLRRG